MSTLILMIWHPKTHGQDKLWWAAAGLVQILLVSIRSNDLIDLWMSIWITKVRCATKKTASSIQSHSNIKFIQMHLRCVKKRSKKLHLGTWWYLWYLAPWRELTGFKYILFSKSGSTPILYSKNIMYNITSHIRPFDIISYHTTQVATNTSNSSTELKSDLLPKIKRTIEHQKMVNSFGKKLICWLLYLIWLYHFS